MSRYNYDDTSWNFQHSDSYDYDRTEEGPTKGEPHPIGFGGPGFRGFGPGRGFHGGHGGHGPQMGSGFHGGHGPQMDFGFGPGRGFHGGHGGHGPQMGFGFHGSHGPHHGSGRGPWNFGRSQAGFGHGFQGAGCEPQAKLDTRIAWLEKFQAHLEQRLEQVKQHLEQLRVERARMQENQPQSQPHHRQGFWRSGSSSETDVSML